MGWGNHNCKRRARFADVNLALPYFILITLFYNYLGWLIIANLYDIDTFI